MWGSIPTKSSHIFTFYNDKIAPTHLPHTTTHTTNEIIALAFCEVPKEEKYKKGSLK